MIIGRLVVSSFRWISNVATVVLDLWALLLVIPSVTFRLWLGVTVMNIVLVLAPMVICLFTVCTRVA